VVAGLLKASGEYIVTLDADLQNPPEEVPRLIEEINKGFDEVSGKRRKRKDSLFRKVPSFFVNLIISTRTKVWLEDYGSMLRVFRRDTARRLAETFMEKQNYITMLIPKITRNIKEIEVSHGERMSGESKYDMKKLLDAFFRIFFASDKSGARSQDKEIFVVDHIVENGKRSGNTLS
jgi:undecaprenyl-phosphate 4-deoxy-4-formamido-L-arabinose transferase